MLCWQGSQFGRGTYLGGVKARVQDEHVALTGATLAAHDAHGFNALQGAARGILAAAGEQGDPAQRRPAFPVFVCMVRQRVQDSLRSHISQRQVEAPGESPDTHAALGAMAFHSRVQACSARRFSLISMQAR